MHQTESNQIEVHDISAASPTSLSTKLPDSDQKSPSPTRQLAKAGKSKTAPAKLVDPSHQEVLYTNKASLNIGQLYRYKITYTPPEVDPDSPSFGSSLFLKIKNLEVVALRAAFLAGPFILYVDVRPEDYDQDKKAYSTADQPMYEPQLKAGQSFYAELFMNKNKRQYTWIVDVVSQIIFSKTAQVQFELSVGTSKEVLHGLSSSLKVPISPISGIVVTRFDTLDIWHSPMPRFDKPLHLVVITHGLHSNTGADMLYVKEAIDKMAKKTGENIIVRGYFDNVRRTEKGIKYLGTRVAEYIVHDLAPEQPINLPPVKKISFIGHSLGGLVQTFAIAYIADHYPEFFKRVEPVNFICLASPLLGISNENPGYIKFALDIGFVGKSGQDISLTRKPNGHSKPLLQILPTGPTHKILVQFHRRTVYANAVNDGIVPLRTSALLYLDWQGLGQVKQAKRDGAVGHIQDSNKGKDHDNDSESSNDTESNETNGLIGKIPREAGDGIAPREMNHHSDPSEEEQKEVIDHLVKAHFGGEEEKSSKKATSATKDEKTSTPDQSTAAWRLHLDTNRDDSEDEGILFAMGNMFDNIREIGNLNFATAFSSATGDANESHEGYTQLNNDGAMSDGQHQLYEEDGDTVGYVSDSNGNRVIQTRNREQDEYDMYGPLNGETIEERLAKQTF
ncbi:hypothetical protein DV495_000652 [Geotrichum candidum]|nr:hypothetical protein DV495_000652 [Geotrichum candidum]